MSFLYNHIRSAFIDRFQTVPQLFRAPGRINLIGEHTDYNDGFVMPAAIDKEIVFAINEADDGKTIIYSTDMNDQVTLNPDRLEKLEDPHWANYLVGILYKLRERGCIIRPFKCVFGGNIPVGSGLSSSAALECGFVYALNTLYQLDISRMDMLHIAQWSEHHYAGVKCGIMDQFSSMMGKENQVFMLDCRSLEYQYFPLTLDGYEIVLLDSNVKHSLASSGYNTRRRECEEGVAILQKRYSTITSLRDVKPETIRKHKNDFPENVFNRCLYVTEEIERVLRAGKDLERGDLVAFGEKMYDTHAGLSGLYEVSCAELDFLVDCARNTPGVVGSRMMGGGFGGCTINIVASAVVKELEAACREKYLETFGIELKVYAVRIVDGVSALDHSF